MIGASQQSSMIQKGTVINMDYQRACSCRYTRSSGSEMRECSAARRRQFGNIAGCTPAPEYAPNFYEYPSLAMTYAPYQKWGETYTVCEALKNATLFPNLNKPFLATQTGTATNTGSRGGFGR